MNLNKTQNKNGDLKMNKQRRNEIHDILSELQSIKTRLEMVQMNEELAFDNMPENLQYSMRGEESQEAIDVMNSAVESLDEAISQLEDI